MYNRDTDSRHIHAICSVQRQYGRQVKRSKTLSAIKTDKAEPALYAKNEIDTRSDTICAGANWRILSDSGQCFDVYGFHDNFKSIKDIPI